MIGRRNVTEALVVHPIRTSPCVGSAKTSMSLIPCLNSSNTARVRVKQYIPVYGRLDTAWAAIEKPRTQRVFEIGNHFRHVGLRYAKLGGGLRHAPVLDDREKQVQVPQAETSANLTVENRAF